MQTSEQPTQPATDLNRIGRRREVDERSVKIQEQAGATQQIDWWFTQIAHGCLLQICARIATQAVSFVARSTTFLLAAIVVFWSSERRVAAVCRGPEVHKALELRTGRLRLPTIVMSAATVALISATCLMRLEAR
jgi:hypothetical protein